MKVEEIPDLTDPVERLVWLREVVVDDESLAYLEFSPELRAVVGHFIGETILMVDEIQVKLAALTAEFG